MTFSDGAQALQRLVRRPVVRLVLRLDRFPDILLCVRTLNVDDILTIHARVALDARTSGEPMLHAADGRSSVKDRGLLESAVARQHAGVADRLFYPGPLENAATLMYGLAKNHAFHDGNKRTSLVAMLNHLDCNRFSLAELKWNEIESMVLELVVGELPSRSKLKHAVAGVAGAADRDIRALSEWIRQNSRSIERGERRMTFDEADQIIRRHGYEFTQPNGNSIGICKIVEEETRNFFGKRSKRLTRHNVGSIGYPGGKREMGISNIKKLRRICRLTEEYGVDSAAFYDEEATLDQLVNKYRKVLRSLADK